MLHGRFFKRAPWLPKAKEIIYCNIENKMLKYPRNFPRGEIDRTGGCGPLFPGMKEF